MTASRSSEGKSSGGTASEGQEIGSSADTVIHESTDVSPQTSSLTSRVPYDLEEGDFEEALPNGESLIAAAVALAVSSSEPGDGIADAQLVQRYWRFAPDEELVDLTPDRVLDAARRHRELARKRRPGELKLRLSLSPEPDQQR